MSKKTTQNEQISYDKQLSKIIKQQTRVPGLSDKVNIKKVSWDKSYEASIANDLKPIGPLFYVPILDNEYVLVNTTFINAV